MLVSSRVQAFQAQSGTKSRGMADEEQRISGEGRGSEKVVGATNSRPGEAEEPLRGWALEGEGRKGRGPRLENERCSYEDRVAYWGVATDDDHG